MSRWSGEFGRAYTDRNLLSAAQLDELYLRRFGITRRTMNVEFLGEVSRRSTILEVGSNIGVQLQCLQGVGFVALCGLELQFYALQMARARTSDIIFVQGSVFDLPFYDESFDLIFTSGVLIHISPDDLRPAMQEIYRCAGRYIWGMEYYSHGQVEVEYRGVHEMLWKADFARIYLDTFPDLRLVKQTIYPHFEAKEVERKAEDAMFLLEKAR